MTLNEDYVAPAARPRWATLSPDEQTVVFARNHNLYMMDAANYAKAQKNANDTSIVETQAHDRRRGVLRLRAQPRGRISRSRTAAATAGSAAGRHRRSSRRPRDDAGQQERPRAPPIDIIWSPDSKRFALIRRDERKVKDLWVINALVEPAADARDLPLRDARRGEHRRRQRSTSSTSQSKKRVKVKADRFKDQTLSIATAPARSASARRRGRWAAARARAARVAAAAGRTGAGAGLPAKWLSASPTRSTSRASAAT